MSANDVSDPRVLFLYVKFKDDKQFNPAGVWLDLRYACEAHLPHGNRMYAYAKERGNVTEVKVVLRTWSNSTVFGERIYNQREMRRIARGPVLHAYTLQKLPALT